MSKISKKAPTDWKGLLAITENFIHSTTLDSLLLENEGKTFFMIIMNYEKYLSINLGATSISDGRLQEIKKLCEELKLKITDFGQTNQDYKITRVEIALDLKTLQDFLEKVIYQIFQIDKGAPLFFELVSK
jgi:hypothetical protein